MGSESPARSKDERFAQSSSKHLRTYSAIFTHIWAVIAFSLKLGLGHGPLAVVDGLIIRRKKLRPVFPREPRDRREGVLGGRVTQLIELRTPRSGNVLELSTYVEFAIRTEVDVDIPIQTKILVAVTEQDLDHASHE